jgi:hypothetical protein
MVDVEKELIRDLDWTFHAYTAFEAVESQHYRPVSSHGSEGPSANASVAT